MADSQTKITIAADDQASPAFDTLSQKAAATAGQLDAMAKEAGDLARGAGDAVPQLQTLAAHFQGLADQQRLITQFRETRLATDAARESFDKAQAHAQGLARALVEAGTPAEAIRTRIAAAAAQVNASEAAWQSHLLALQQARRVIEEAGLSSTGLANAQRSIHQALTQGQQSLAAAAQNVEAVKQAQEQAAQAAKAQATEENRLAGIVTESKKQMAKAAQEQLAAEKQHYAEAQVAARQYAQQTEAAKRQAVQAQIAEENRLAGIVAESKKQMAQAAQEQLAAEKQHYAEAQVAARQYAQQTEQINQRIASSNERAFALLGVESTAALKGRILEIRQALQKLAQDPAISEADWGRAAAAGEKKIEALEARLKDAAGSMDDMGRAGGRLEGDLGGLGAAAELLGTRIKPLAAALGGLGSGAGIVAAARAAMNFESAMADVAKVVDGTDAQIAALASRIKVLATELPIGAAGLAQIAAAGGQLGVPIDKLETFINLAARMATAFNMNAEQAGEAVAKLSNVFNLPIEQVEALGDAINTLGNTTSARERDIVDVLTRVGGTASQFGLTAEQAAALGTAMLSLGVSSEVAGTGINALLSKLQTANVQGKDFRAALGDMGLSAKQLAADIRAHPQHALTEFLRTLEKLDDQSRAETLTRLFGQEYQDDIARLLGGLQQYESALQSVSERSRTAGAMQKEFQTRLETTENQFNRLKQGVETLAINLGEILLPVLNPMIASLGDAAGAAAQFAETFPAIAGVAGALLTAAASAASLRMAWSALAGAAKLGLGDMKALSATLTTDLSASIAQVGKLQTALTWAAGAASAAWIGWNVGTYLREEFKEIELLGIALAAGLTKAAARVQGAWEMAQAPFNDDTLEAAYDRMQARLAEIDNEYAEIFNAALRAKTGQVEGANAATAAVDKTAQATARAAAEEKKRADDAAIAYKDLLDSFKALGLDGAAALGKISTESQAAIDNLDGIVTALQATPEAAADAGGAIEKAFVAALGKIDSLKALDVLEQKLDGVGQIGAGAMARIRAEMENMRRRLEGTTPGIQSMEEALSQLGVNTAVALGRITPATQTLLAALDQVAAELARTGTQGQAAAGVIEMAFASAFAKVDNLEGLAALEQKMRSVGQSAGLGAQSMARMRDEFDKARLRIEALAPGLQSVEEAFKALGMASQTELKRAADQAEQAFNTIANSGEASAQQIKAAFQAWADAVAAANLDASGEIDKTTQGLIKTKAELNGLKVDFDEAGKVIVQTAREAGDAIGLIAAAGQEAGEKASWVKQTWDETGRLIGESMAEAAQKHNAGIGGIATGWLDASEAASQYAGAANDVARAAYDYSMGLANIVDQHGYIAASAAATEAARDAALGYIATMERLDAQQKRISSSGAQGLEDMRLQLLKLTGSAEDYARAEEAHERARIERQIALMRIEMQRAQKQGDSDEAARLREEIGYYQAQLKVLEQIQKAERAAEQSGGGSGAHRSGGGVSSGGQGGGAGAPAAPERTVQLNINLGGGRTHALYSSKDTAEAFVRELERAASVSAYR